jgi:hypothetical protein
MTIPNAQVPTPNSQPLPISSSQLPRTPNVWELGVGGGWELGIGSWKLTSLASLTVLLWLAVFVTPPALAQDDPFTGTWVLNVPRSKMQPATASKSEIIHYKITGDEEDFLSDAVTIEGYPESIKYTARYNDGKAYPFSITINGKVTNPGAMTMVKKIDTWTRERYNVRDGKPVIASRRLVSRDGRTMTLTILRTDAQGREVVNEVRILEKRP